MRLPFPHLEAERTLILLPGSDFAERMVHYYRRNEEHLRPWEPDHCPEFWTEEWWRRQLERNQREYQSDLSARMVVLLRGEPERGVIGVVNLSNIVRGAFHAGYLGYSIAREHEGRGLMREAVGTMLDLAFGAFGLHRVMANYQPLNTRSAHLLERLGFVREGYARDYLWIDGAWRDHVLTALTNPRWVPGAGPQGRQDLDGDRAR